MSRCRSSAPVCLLAVTPSERIGEHRNAIRILVWFCASAVFWICGGLAEGETRLWLWVVALVIEYLSPVMRFWIPVYGASAIEDWYVEGGHMAERCAGFIMIALGEAIVVNGATFTELTWTSENVAAFVSAFVASIAMWWIYFHRGAEAGSELISKSAESGRVARLAYTYLHMPIVAGIILSAVADEARVKASKRPYRSEDSAERRSGVRCCFSSVRSCSSTIFVASCSFRMASASSLLRRCHGSRANCRR